MKKNVAKYILCLFVFAGLPNAFAQNDSPDIHSDDPKTNYNAGVAAYRKDDFKAAKDLFTKSLVTEDRALEPKAEYNAGNAFFKIAKSKEAGDSEGAIDALKAASHYYQKTIELDPKDLDAKYNHELSQKLLKILLEKPKTQSPKKQNEQQKNQDQQQQSEQKEQQSQQQQQQESEQKNKQDQQQQPKDGQDQQEKNGGQGQEEQLSEQEARMLASQYGQEGPRLELNHDQNAHEKNVAKDW